MSFYSNVKKNLQLGKHLRLAAMPTDVFKRMLIEQNAGRKNDEGEEPSKRGELIPVFKNEFETPTERYHILGVQACGQWAACCAYGVSRNERKKGKRNSYLRIDVVITTRKFRRLGFANLAVIGAMQKALMDWEGTIYSISCLCAHQGMTYILEPLPGFNFEWDERKHTMDAHLQVKDSTEEILRKHLSERLPAVAQQAAYHYRQSLNDATT